MKPNSDQGHRCVWDTQAWDEAKMKQAIKDGNLAWTNPGCDAHQKKQTNDPKTTNNPDLMGQSSTDGGCKHNHPNAKVRTAANTVHAASTLSAASTASAADTAAAASVPGQPAQAAQPAQAGRFAKGIKINGSLIKPNDSENIEEALQLLYKQFTAMTFCPDRHQGSTSGCANCAGKLIYDDKPVFGPPTEDLLKAPEFYVDDLRPTLDSEVYLTHHCGIQDCQVCIKYYLNCRKPGEVTTIAKSGPVLKHLPAFYALLYPTADETFPNLEEVCGIAGHALSLLMKHEVRVTLPNSLPDIEAHFGLHLDASGPSGAAAIKAAVGNDLRKRAEIVASLTLSLYGDLIRACKTTPEEYDATYTKYAAALEGENNPWGEDLFWIAGTPGKKFRMPFWGPMPNACRCANPACKIAEHDVEVYHRTQTLVRWALNQMVDPAVYYHRKNGIGNARRVEYEEKYVFRSVKRILGQQKAERDQPARLKKLAQIKKKVLSEGAAKIFQDNQGCTRLHNLLRTSRTAGMVVPALLVNSSATKIEAPFPVNGDVKLKEAWVKTLEDMVWSVLATGGMTRITHPAIVPEVRWFCRYRAQVDHGYSAIPTAQDIIDNKLDRRREYTPEYKRMVEVNSVRTEIAIKNLKTSDANFKIGIEETLGPDGKAAFVAWVASNGQAVMDIFMLAGASLTDRTYLLAVVSQWACYYYVAKRTKRDLHVGPEPTDDEIDIWCSNLIMMAGCRYELSFYFRDRVSDETIKNMLEALLRACHPGESWLYHGAERPGAAARARRQYLRNMQN